MALNEINIGTTYVTVEARIKQAEADLDAFEKKAEETATKVDGAADKIGESFTDAGRKVDAGMEQAEKGVEEFTKEIEQAKPEVVQLERELDKLGDQAKKTGREVKDATGSATGRFSEATKGLSALREGLSKLFIPVALALGVSRIVEGIRAARLEAEKLRQGFANIANEAERTSNRTLLGDRITELKSAQIAVIDATNAAQQSILDKIDQQAERSNSVFEVVRNAIAGASFDSFAESAEEAANRVGQANARQIIALGRQASEERIRAIEAETEAEVRSRMDAIDRLAIEEREAIDDVLEQRARATTQAERDALTERIGAIQTEYAYRGQAEQDLIDARRAADKERAQNELQQIESQIRQIERAALSDADRRKAEVEDQITELEGRIDRATREAEQTGEDNSDLVDALNRLIALTRQQAEESRSERAETKKALQELPERTGRATGEAVRRVLSDTALIRTPITLGAMLNNLNLIASQMGRGRL